MKLLGNGWAVTETTFAGTTAGGGGMGSTGTYGAGPSMTIRKVTAFSGGSTVAANTSGGLHLRVGESSDNITSTYVILPMMALGEASSNATPPLVAQPLSVNLDGLSIKCSWFECVSQEAAAGGWAAYIFGD